MLAIAAFVLQAGRQGSDAGRHAVAVVAGAGDPLFLLAAWYLEQLPLDPENLSPLQRAAHLTSWGMLLLLAPWPLHGPAVSLGEEAPPLVAAWLLTALAAVPVTLLQTLLVRYEWLQGATLFAELPNAAAGRAAALRRHGRCLWAGLAGAVQTNISRLWSYAALFAYGACLSRWVWARAARGHWSGCC